jgi:sortase A
VVALVGVKGGLMTRLAEREPLTTAPRTSATGEVEMPSSSRGKPRWLAAVLRHTRPTPARPTPRDARWAAGAILTAVSVLLLGFVAQVSVFSSLQHQRDLVTGYADLRTSLAKGEAPVGQLDANAALVAPATPVALLQIAKLGLSEVVREGTTADVLRSGPGHRRDTVMPGQAGTAVIMARQTSYGGPFAHLGRLIPGDELTLTTGQGVQTYRVFSLRRAGDPQPKQASAGEGRLELLTADGLALFPSGVLHVDAALVGTVQPASSRVMAYAALPSSERAMGSDQSAWPLAVLAVLGLILVMAAIQQLWRRWGWRLAWLIGIPVLLALGTISCDLIINALPNLL